MNKILVFLLFALCVIGASTFAVLGQQQEKHKGVALFEAAKYAEAVTVLKAAVKDRVYKTDPVLWNHLGLSYIKIDRAKDAAKAFEKAIDLDPKNSVYRQNASYAYLLSGNAGKALSAADKAIEADPTAVAAYYLRGNLRLWGNKLDKAAADANSAVRLAPTYHGGYSLQAEVLLAELGEKAVDFDGVRANFEYLKNAKQVLEIGVTNTAGTAGNSILREHLDSIEPFYKMFSKPKPQTADGPEPLPPGVKNYLITSKPIPRYTDAARNLGTSGRIRMLVTLGADSKIGRILVLSRLPNGLTEQALAAAKKIQFTPRMENGVPKAVVVMIEYGFDIY